MSAIFLSHCSKNDALARSLTQWLKSNGFTDIFADHEAIHCGDKWTEALRRAKGACRVVMCLVTPEWLASDECFGEFTAGWYAGKRIIPLVSVSGARLDERQQARLNRVLLEDQGIELKKSDSTGSADLGNNSAIADRLKAGLRAAGALVAVGLDPYAFEIDRAAQPEPFPGLASFGDTDADAAIFFGRSAEIARCLEDLREIRATGDRRCYTILGSSGSGKSSLMKAGVLPRLRRERGWFVLRAMRPGSDPLYNFSESIAMSAPGGQMSAGAIRDKLLAAWIDRKNLRTELDSIIEPIKSSANRSGATVLIPIDQAEELARVQGDSVNSLSEYLVSALANFNQEEPAAFRLVLTVRSDCLRELEGANNFEQFELRLQTIRPLPAYRFDMAIEQPAARYGVEMEPQLVEAMMDDAGGHDSLPLLAFALQRLWRQYHNEQCIRKINYDGIGRLSAIIEDAAEKALSRIDPAVSDQTFNAKVPESLDKAAARVFIPGLAQVNERGAPIRRVAQLSSFDSESRALLDSFERWRLVVKSGENVEVAHEALFREWPRFQKWLVPERDRLEILRGIESAALAWSAKGRTTDDLIHRGKRLREAQALDERIDYRMQLDKHPDARNYLKYCKRASRVRTIRISLVGLLVAIGLILAFKAQIVATIAELKLVRAVQRASVYRSTAPILAPGQDLSKLPSNATFRDCIDCPEMVKIQSGTFMMGSPESEANREPSEGPQHPVRISAFSIGKFDVTFDEWAACVKDGGCRENPRPSDAGWGRGRRPVIFVSWKDAVSYANWLSSHTGQKYRLPTSAEWEYAARAGTTSPYWTGKTISHFQANFSGGPEKTQPVGSYPPNSWGLFDMAGNVWQWVEDCAHENYAGAPSDGSAWEDSDCRQRLLRGGSYTNRADVRLRSAFCIADNIDARYDNVGFRVVRFIPP